MTKIYTFDAESTAHFQVSIAADSLDAARKLIEKLDRADEVKGNLEVGSGRLTVDFVSRASGREDSDPDDGSHYWTTPRENAAENAAALEMIDEYNTL